MGRRKGGGFFVCFRAFVLFSFQFSEACIMSSPQCLGTSKGHISDGGDGNVTPEQVTQKK